MYLGLVGLMTRLPVFGAPGGWPTKETYIYISAHHCRMRAAIRTRYHEAVTRHRQFQLLKHYIAPLRPAEVYFV